MSFRSPLTSEEFSKEYVNCEEDECAWWDNDGASCGVLIIAEQLKRLEREMAIK
jgi:hypothetical protein